MLLIIILFGFTALQAEELIDYYPKIRQLAKTENINIDYYTIEGNSVAALNNEMKKKGPFDQFSVKRDAYVGWYINWQWPGRNNKPDFLNTTSTCSIQFIAPKWKLPSKPNSQLLSKWKSFIKAIEVHELEHIRFALDNYQSISDKIIKAYKANPALTDKEANRIGYNKLEEIRALDLEYDKKTKHGRTQGCYLE